MPRKFALTHTSILPSARHPRGETAHASGSWRAVSQGSLGPGWQSSFSIPKLFKRPHKRAPSIWKRKRPFADRQKTATKQELDLQTLSRDSEAIWLLLVFRRFIDFTQEGPVAQHVLG